MFIPLHDANSLKHIRLQWVTLALIAANFAIYALTSLSPSPGGFSDAAVLGLGFIPSVVHDFAELPAGLAIVPEDWTYLTYSFLHADIVHVASNMLFLWVFGDNVEDALGHVRFLFFYLATAAAGAFLHGLLLPDSDAPLIGASGAVAGVVAAYLMLHPRVRVWILAFGRIPLPLPAYVPLLLWIALQFFMLVTDRDGEISWATHAGGIIAGAFLILILRRRGVPLFDRTIATPQAVVHVEAGPVADEAVEDGRGRPPHWGR